MSRPLAPEAGDGVDNQLLALALEGDRASVSREQKINRDFWFTTSDIFSDSFVKLMLMLSEE